MGDDHVFEEVDPTRPLQTTPDLPSWRVCARGRLRPGERSRRVGRGPGRFCRVDDRGRIEHEALRRGDELLVNHLQSEGHRRSLEWNDTDGLGRLRHQRRGPPPVRRPPDGHRSDDGRRRDLQSLPCRAAGELTRDGASDVLGRRQLHGKRGHIYRERRQLRSFGTPGGHPASEHPRRLLIGCRARIARMAVVLAARHGVESAGHQVAVPGLLPGQRDIAAARNDGHNLRRRGRQPRGGSATRQHPGSFHGVPLAGHGPHRRRPGH